MIDELMDELMKERTCTIATANLTGKTEAATILFVSDKDYNIYFTTFNTSRKYSNLIENPQASLVVTKVEETKSVQIDGIVTEISGEDAEQAKLLKEKKFGVSDFDNDPSTRYFKFVPAWIRTLRYSNDGLPIWNMIKE